MYSITTKIFISQKLIPNQKKKLNYYIQCYLQHTCAFQSTVASWEGGFAIRQAWVWPQAYSWLIRSKSPTFCEVLGLERGHIGLATSYTYRATNAP